MVKVFLSYRHENDASHPDHQQRVRELGEKLRAAGFEVVLDQFYQDAHPGGPDEQWPKWCENQVPEAEKVLIVASAGYFRCYEQKENPGLGLGAACETTVIRNTLYKCAYKTDKFRFVYFDRAHVKNMPTAIEGIHRFNVCAPDELKHLITWLDPKTPTVSAPIKPSVIWPTLSSGFEPDLANRTAEFTAFVNMLKGESPVRAIFFKAPTAHGKTTLVAECMRYARQVLGFEACVTIDFKGNPTRETALETISLGLASRLPHFAKAGSHTREFRADLRALSAPVLLLFDTYEQASDEARELVQNLLLGDLDQTPALRIVVAGQIVPDHEKAFWAKSVTPFTLGPISDAAHWERYAQRHHPHLRPDQIQTLTDATLGHPGYIKTLLAGLAQKHPV